MIHHARLVCAFVPLAVALTGCSAGQARAEGLLIPHPDDSARKVEYFVQKPVGRGPWPTVIFVHGHQNGPRPGGKDFLTWGVLDRFAQHGYLAVSVSQPGFGASTGPADFCGPLTQHAVSAVLAKLRKDGDASDKVVIEGISRGALVAGLIAAHDRTIAGIILISGLYDLPAFLANPPSAQAKLIAQSIAQETDGQHALGDRSVLHFAQNIKAAALILNGAKDDRTDPQQARKLAEIMNAHGAKARVIIYPEYGHQIPVTARDEVIDQFIKDVLDK